MPSHDLTREIIGAAIKIHRELGPGLLESAYEACLAYELQKLGLKVERQKPVLLIYEQVRLECGFRADLVVEGRVVIETMQRRAASGGQCSAAVSSSLTEHSRGTIDQLPRRVAENRYPAHGQQLS